MPELRWSGRRRLVGDAWRERMQAERAFVEDCRARFADLAAPWLHVSDDGRLMWLTDGEDGPVLAEIVLPPWEATDA